MSEVLPPWPQGAGPIVSLGAHVQALFVDVDRVPREGETVRGTAITEPVDGGKSTCHAVAAARLGAPVTFVSVVGSDDRGRWWRTYLDGEGVDTRWLATREGATDTGVVLLPPSRVPAIVSVTALSEHLDVPVVRAAAPAIEGASMIICSLECPPASVKEAFRIGRAAGVRTLLNPAPADGIDDELVRLADILVPNEHEAAHIAGHAGGPAELAMELAARFAPVTVVVTAGRGGVVLARAGRDVVHVPAPEVVVVDTTGAGDAFVGAFAACLGRGMEAEEAVRRGVAAASWSVTRAGSIDSYATATELEGVIAGAMA